MKTRVSLITTGMLLAVAGSALATVRYVNLNSPSPMPPYTNWATAARVIQDAVDAAAAGDEVVVTNGTYATGGRAVFGTMTNRLAVDKPLTVRSINGPQFTVIQGYQVPGTTNGDGAIRCVYLANGASLSGFTLTNGATRSLGDYREGSGGGVWCEERTVMVSNCTLTGNSAADWGGGAYWHDGGAYWGPLSHCTLIGNSAQYGGGAYGCTLNNCTLNTNAAVYGGGAAYCTVNDCALSGNSASYSGGGAHGGALNNCALSSNWAAYYGGGACGDDVYEPILLNNCTLTRNWTSDAAGWGGGVYYGTLNNCIVHLNAAGDSANYDASSVLNYCCTTPLPAAGRGNFSADPRLANASHISANSPCRAAGSSDFAGGADIDGEPWASPPAIGCDEYHTGAVTGALSVAISAAYTNVSAGYPVELTAAIEGRASSSVWDFGDAMTATNQPFTAHAWTTAGDKAIVLRVFNESQPAGITATTVVHVVAQAVHYVSAESVSPEAPYASWATAATNIQDAIGAAIAGSTILVSNGIYTTGEYLAFGLLTNQVAVDKPLALQSVSGPQFTIIDGGYSGRCVSLVAGASLSGFTLSNGFSWSGAGVWCAGPSAALSNCVLTGNSALRYGGGAYGGTLNDCVLAGNQQSCRCAVAMLSGPGDDSYGSGGGAYGSALNHCALSTNSSIEGGGVAYGTLNYCTLSLNYATDGGGAHGAVLNNCSLSGNAALREGGGAYGSILNSCTLSGNSATNSGGGASDCALNNCIAYFNIAGDGPNYDDSSTLNYCCTTPTPEGSGNITNAPLFVDLAGGNLRLQSNSPCINAGYNAYVPTGSDLDGNPRIVGGTVDIGAYEFQTPTSVISYAWLQRYGLPNNGSADSADTDGDGMNNWQEWRVGTSPTNPSSVLRLLRPAVTSTNVTISWQSVLGINYFLERTTNPAAPGSFAPIATGIPGQDGVTSYSDTNLVSSGPVFYRVGVGN